MSVYVHVRYEVIDAEAYGRYRALAGPSVKAHQGSVVMRATQTQTLEGSGGLTNVTVLQFPSVEAAESWYQSAAYQAAKAERDGAGAMHLDVLVAKSS